MIELFSFNGIDSLGLTRFSLDDLTATDFLC